VTRAFRAATVLRVCGLKPWAAGGETPEKNYNSVAEGKSSWRFTRKFWLMSERPSRSAALVVLSVGWITLFAGLTAQARVAAEGSVKITQDFGKRKLQIDWTALPKVGRFRVILDDSPTLRQPILSEDVRQNHLTLDVLEAGLAPGITYYARIEPGEMQDSFRLTVPPWPEPYLNYAYLRKAWETTGRKWLTTYSGVNWKQATQKWEFDPQWPPQDSMAAQNAYYLEYAARAGVNMGLACHDLPLLNELAEFFLAYYGRFATLGEMRQMKSASVDTSELERQGDDKAKTLIWVIKEGERSRVLECELCNSQFLHPVARLIRVITTLPSCERTPSMRSFVNLYVPILLHDHLMRELFWGPNYVADWEKSLALPTRPKMHQALDDRDLWLIATSAEMLGANANEPGLVPMTADENSRLRGAVQVGVDFFQKERTILPETKNFKGQAVGSASYFDGDWYGYRDYAYSGYIGEAFPTLKDKRVHPGTSWDVSHFYRVPVFLRALYDNKKATGLAFPSAHDIELVTNQLMYRVFQGNFERPLFNNFFDGSNGWYRVGYHGADSGYPPSGYCRADSPNLFCMTSGSIMGWGLIAFFNPDLIELEHSLLTLGWREDPETKSFKDRYYEYHGSYSLRDVKGEWQYPVLLLWVLAGIPQRLQGCGAP
jgi:hypothetical protein